MAQTQVILTPCGNYSRQLVAEKVAKQFELAGGVGRFVRRGDSVLVKPNLIAPKPAERATQTHPSVILETVRLLKDFGAKPFVGDSPAWSNAANCIEALNLSDALEKLDVPVRQLNNPKKCRIGRTGTIVGISTAALEADVIINLPKFKVHRQLGATFAVKNMFGCVSGKKKVYWHFVRGRNPAEFCRLLLEIYEYLNPAFTIIDGVMAMEASGPIRGRNRQLGWLIGGVEPIACETVCSKMVGFGEESLPILRTARRLGYKYCNPEDIKIVSDDAALEGIPAVEDFEPAEMIPIRFSLLHVIKSVCKQIYLLATGGDKE